MARPIAKPTYALKSSQRHYPEQHSYPIGPVELLSAIPSQQSNPSQAPLFFAHGGFGCAEIWILYMQFVESGIPCYAVSYRGHGKSWYPGFWQLCFMRRHSMAEDLTAGVKHVEKIEGERRGVQEKVRVIPEAHSTGGALSQYALSRGMIKVHSYCMFAAVPGFGSFGCYQFWALAAIPNFYYRLFHPKYLMATTKQIYDAFFTPWTPTPVVLSLERLLSPYESTLRPMRGLFKFVTGPDVLSSITGWTSRPSTSGNKDSEARQVSQNLSVLADEHDVLCTRTILEDAAMRYRAVFFRMVEMGKLDGVKESDLVSGKEKGVRFRVVGCGASYAESCGVGEGGCGDLGVVRAVVGRFEES
ncbi:hypothetical protein K458DRAFT_492057 [Lentithecium fluviatile CBS 122367]|uniref:AB hydrolase-1 domain-containing protein n=1 Tax=Lentithecium fluviatile CBS 122367 TaxID=1168545 RepID=A0A6G1IH00_9PLEO|nr:hypothetical protein K458DRAFT_492057 [Lentithecium fluviatile CBS 122367]